MGDRFCTENVDNLLFEHSDESYSKDVVECIPNICPAGCICWMSDIEYMAGFIYSRTRWLPYSEGVRTMIYWKYGAYIKLDKNSSVFSYDFILTFTRFVSPYYIHTCTCTYFILDSCIGFIYFIKKLCLSRTYKQIFINN